MGKLEDGKVERTEGERAEVGSGTRRRPIVKDYGAARCGRREGQKMRRWEVGKVRG